MNKIFTALFSGLITIFSLQNAYTQIPSYELCVRNITHITINYPDDAIVFDIYLRNTNPPVELDFTVGLFYHDFDTSIFNPPPPYPPPSNDSSYISYKVIASDLPFINESVNSRFIFFDTPILLLTISRPGGGYIISSDFPGTLMARMRIWNKLGSMNNVPLKLSWRNPPIAAFNTRVFAYIGTVLTDITTPETHCIDTTLTQINIQNTKPEEFILHQNYPNPFNPVTKISYELRVTNYVTLKIFDVSGKLVAILVNQKQNAGNYSVEWDAGGFGSGVYVCRMEVGGYIDTKRILLIK